MNERTVELMECTLRDGSYAVDFAFTAADTALLVSQLDRLGFKWIEIGHGQGLGASRRSGRGMSATDVELIQAARAVSRSARLGMFFIPGFGETADLIQARDSGLDFIRVGYDVASAQKTVIPCVKQCMDLGFRVFVNFMKSYAVSPETFGELAAKAADFGVDGVYLVDSAGHMTPRDVGKYVAAACSRTKTAIGFHGHDNLRLAAANCLAAFEHGAAFLDCTLFGIGRDAGNPPSEVLVALFDKPEASCGIDLFEILDTAEHYIRPLARNLQSYDMLSVAMGHAGFHSSFLPEVLRLAGQHRVDPKRMIMETGSLGHAEPDKEVLAAIAAKYRDSSQPSDSSALMDAPDSQSESASIDVFMERMKRISSKKPAAGAAILFTPAREEAEGEFRGSIIASLPGMTLGRAVYGTREVFCNLLRAVAGKAAMSCILDRSRNAPPWSRDAHEWAKESIPGLILSELDADRLVDAYLAEVLQRICTERGGRVLLLIEQDRHEGGVWRQNMFDASAVVVSACPDEHASPRFEEYSACMCLCNLTGETGKSIFPLLGASGRVYVPAERLHIPASQRIVPVDTGPAFYGALERLAAGRAAAAGGTPAEQRRVRTL